MSHGLISPAPPPIQGVVIICHWCSIPLVCYVVMDGRGHLHNEGKCPTCHYVQPMCRCGTCEAAQYAYRLKHPPRDPTPVIPTPEAPPPGPVSWTPVPSPRRRDSHW